MEASTQGRTTALETSAGSQMPDAAQGLVQLAGLVQAAFARAADQHHLTPVQARLLCVLAEGPRGMADLARGFGVEKAALTGLVDRAERRGLVERVRVAGDRRAVRVALTDAGHLSAAAFHAEVTRGLHALVAPLPPEERVTFEAALAAIAHAAGSSGLWGLGRAC
ncbi:MarR family transcriptional regulator [Sinomonas sp. JGH33]|uniref:MarR family transcriptional regulator n=1 Tax=Sinomonas terricola TaxID=3110330 RepID=A0ABU5T5F7_9MICC|nr:MarR family transcriptional regulator [Sinomonas sp. JGH33]MEA5454894.1 MarR family transcriptional regulator [Sinomonas sp. JGH33]